MDANLREQMLAKGDVDVITGFLTSAVPTLNGLGIRTADLNVMKYDDYNLDGFGNAVFATRDFVEKSPKTVMAFVKGPNRLGDRCLRRESEPAGGKPLHREVPAAQGRAHAAAL